MTDYRDRAIRFLKKFGLQQSGGVAIAFSISAVTIVFAGGMAVDYGRALSLKSKLQSTLDAAVLAGVRGNLDAAAMAGTLGNGTDAEKIQVATDYFQANLPSSGTISTPDFTFANNNLVGTVNATVPMMLTKVLGFETMAFSLQSIASIEPLYRPICFLAMHPTRKHTLELDQAVSVIAPDCHIYGNSSHFDDVVDPHTPLNFIVAKSVQANGYGHNYLVNVTPPLEHAPEIIADPLAARVMPVAGSCLHTGLVVSGTTTLNPGTYCGGLTIDSGADVTFNPGLYIISGGAFSVSNATISGNEVTIALADTAATLNWSNAQIRLSAPTSGTYASMVLIGVRQPMTHVFFESVIDLHGVVYLLNGDIIWTNTGIPAITALWTAWIVDGVSWLGDGEVHINFDPENSPVPYPVELNKIPRPGSPRILS